MKKQNENMTEVQATETTTTQNEQTTTNTKKATKATTKKEEKKMAETKKSTETKTEQVKTTDERFASYKTNEAGEFLMTEDMLKEFLETTGLVQAKSSKDATLRGIRENTKGSKPFAKVRIDETAKKKQVHIHTGATKKTVSGKADDGVRYKVIFREKTGKYECWNATPDGKRKMLKRGTQEEAMAEYESHFQKAEKKTTKKSA